MFQTGDVLYGEGKLRDLGMVFKPSFKCLKNKKINLSPAFLKLETLLFQNMFLLFHLILYSQSDFDSKKKKKWSKRKKNMPYSEFYFQLKMSPGHQGLVIFQNTIFTASISKAVMIKSFVQIRVLIAQ